MKVFQVTLSEQKYEITVCPLGFVDILTGKTKTRTHTFVFLQSDL